MYYQHDINNKNGIFCFRTINIEEIREAVGKVKTSKGFGIDHISIKLTIPYIENSLTFVFNTSIGNSVFPDIWKTARVTPISKMVTRLIKRTIVLFQILFSCCCFAYRGTAIWNSLPREIKSSRTFDSFKRKLKAMLVEQY